MNYNVTALLDWPVPFPSPKGDRPVVAAKKLFCEAGSTPPRKKGRSPVNGCPAKLVDKFIATKTEDIADMQHVLHHCEIARYYDICGDGGGRYQDLAPLILQMSTFMGTISGS
jgi:hypothetical protein